MKNQDFIPSSPKQRNHIGIPDGSVDYASKFINSTNRTPLEQFRVFKTKAQLNAYIEDRLLYNGTISETVTDETVKSAFPGLILSVVLDENEENNGVYEVYNANPELSPLDGTGTGLAARKIGSGGGGSVTPITEDQIDTLFTDVTDTSVQNPEPDPEQESGTLTPSDPPEPESQQNT